MMMIMWVTCLQLSLGVCFATWQNYCDFQEIFRSLVLETLETSHVADRSMFAFKLQIVT